MADEEEEDLRSRTDARLARRTNEDRLAHLARTLVGLSRKQRNRLELDEALRDELDEADRMPNARALARQLRVVRRQLRAGDLESVERAVHLLLNPHPAARVAASAPAPVGVEGEWLERMVREGSVEAFMAEHPDADRQRLRTLLRNLSKAQPKSRAKAERALRAALREALA